MNNQKGEVVTGVMVVIMAVAMVFGMVFMHGGHDKNSHAGKEQQQERSSHDEHKEVK